MAGTIKGLTIEIGGTTTKLTQALKEPQKETQSLRSKLKDVDGALKFDTKNVDLLDQKQRLLGQTINSTEQELKLLKQAQQEYVDSGKDIDGAEYVALEKKIGITEKALENLKNQQNNFNGELQALGMKVGEFGEKTEALGKKFLPVTAGVTAVGTAATAAWSELDDAYDGIAAGTGATGEALKDLQQNFDNVYGSFPADSADVSTAIADINTRFGLSGQALEEASVKFLQYAKVNNVDVSGSIENVAKAMYDAGIPTEELGTVLDKLTVASQASGLPVDQLSAALSKNGVNMRELGYSTDETIAILTTFEKQGVDTSTVLTGMKGAVKNCAKEGKDAKVEMANLFEAIQNGSATAADAQELFGSKAGTAIYNYAKEGKLNINDMMKVIEGSAGGLEATFNEMLDPADQMQIAMNNLKIAGAELGSAIQSVLAPMLEKLAEICRKVAEWFKGLDDSQKETIVKIGLLAAAIGPALIAIGKMSTGLSQMIKYFGSVQTMGGKVISSFKALTGASSLGIGAFAGIVAAVAAVGGAFATLWQTNEEFRAKMTEIWDSIVGKVKDFCQGIVDRINSLGFNFKDITEVVKAVWQEFCDFLAPIFEGVWKQVEIIITTALDIIMGVVDTFIALFQGDWDGFWKGIQDIVDACWQYIHDGISNFIEMITNCISEFLSWFGIKWEADLDAIQQKWDQIWQSIKDFIDSIIQAIQEQIAGFIDLFNGDWDGFCSHVSEAWNILWEGIKQFGSDIWNGIKDVFSGVWDNIRQIWDDCMQAIKSKCEEIWNNIQSFLSGIWDGIKGTCQNVWNTIKDNIINPITDAWNSVQRIFGDIQNWITDKINGARDAVGSAIDAIKGFFNFEFHWPHIPLPHFTISGSINPLDWFDGGLPSIGVEWYAKAMHNGMILDQPTAFGINSDGQVMAAGEAGPEAVIGVNSLRMLINDAVEQAAMRKLEQIRQVQEAPETQTISIDYDKLAGSLLAALSGIVIQNSVNIGLKQVLNELLPLIDSGLEKRKKRR